MDELTRDEQSLLLFFETCVVDRGGNVVTDHLNNKDQDVAMRWHNDGFVTYQRIKSNCQAGPSSMNVAFSDEAWALAHKHREQRGKRNERPTEELVARNRKAP